jgi:hypothetical protein
LFYQKNFKNKNMDGEISYRFVVYRKHLLFETESVACRGFWCPSISLCKQEAEVKKLQLTETDIACLTGKGNFNTK